MSMDRRRLLKSGTTLAAGTALLDWAHAWATEQPFTPEAGAKLRFLRWGKFLDAEEQATNANIAAFTRATGVEVTVESEWQDDIQTKAAVAANVGSGPDIVWALHTTPHMFPDKLLDLTAVADYLGPRYGGWYPIVEEYGKHDGRWIGIPSILIGIALVYRESMVRKAGFETFPGDTQGLLSLCKALQKAGTPAGFCFGKSPNDAATWCHWLMWSHGGRLVDEHNQPAIRSAQTVAALAYAQEIYPTLVPGTAGWNDASNNKAFLAGDVSLTNNAVSIYGKTRADKMAIADDIDHANFPVGPVGVPTEMHLLYPLMVFSYTKYPDAARAFITFMMEAPQYNALLERSIGYITQTLKAYEANPVWTSDPKTALFKSCSARARSIAYAGTLGYPAASALADFVVVDMFAEVVTGQSSPEDAMARAEMRTARYYKA
jgi:multiple sugar transport system substrate-binding protein